ncbi:MAG TPA: ORF6N domain-containing protein [Thermodesulfobacteriota bacterium]|nr:ORF6N domain-containing protein [Thermodesulfobacteriota bacterium]
MDIVKLERVEDKIIEIGGHKVLLDSDVAELYEVETKRINEAVKNNPDKFPDGYLLEVSEDEWKKLKSKFSSSIKGGKVKPPKAFTEKGLYMLATILKSEKATSTTIAIIETFAKIKTLAKNIKELSKSQQERQKQNLLQNQINEKTLFFAQLLF